MDAAALQEWQTFALVVGSAAGALVGLLFVAISIRATTIAASADLRSRAGQTLVIFASLLLIALLLSVPGQSGRLFGAELVVVAALSAGLLIFLDRRAEASGPSGRLSRVVKAVSPNTITSVGTAAAGVLLLCGIRWGIFLLVPWACVAVVGGLASAWLFLTKLTD
jgi:tagatose-1,6-bisphosphate aldolase